MQQIVRFLNIKNKLILILLALLTFCIASAAGKRNEIPSPVANIFLYSDGSLAFNKCFPEETENEFASNGMAIVKSGGGYGYIGLDGEYTITPKFYRAHDFSNGLAVVDLDSYKSKYINEKGEFAFNAEFPIALDFASNGLACVLLKNPDNWAFIDKTGAVVADPKKYKSVDGSDDNVLNPTLKKSFMNAFVNFVDVRKYGYTNAKGEFVIQPIYDEANAFGHDGLARVKIKDKHGYINTKGEFVIAPQYYDAYDFHNGLAPVYHNDAYDFIDVNGNMVISPLFNSEPVFHYGNLISGRNKDGIWKLINFKGETIVSLNNVEDYRTLSVSKNGLIKYRQNGKWMLIDKYGNNIKSSAFDRLVRLNFNCTDFVKTDEQLKAEKMQREKIQREKEAAYAAAKRNYSSDSGTTANHVTVTFDYSGEVLVGYIVRVTLSGGNGSFSGNGSGRIVTILKGYNGQLSGTYSYAAETNTGKFCSGSFSVSGMKQSVFINLNSSCGASIYEY